MYRIVKIIKGLISSLILSLPIGFGIHFLLSNLHQIESPETPFYVACSAFGLISLHAVFKPESHIDTFKSVATVFGVLSILNWY